MDRRVVVVPLTGEVNEAGLHLRASRTAADRGSQSCHRWRWSVLSAQFERLVSTDATQSSWVRHRPTRMGHTQLGPIHSSVGSQFPCSPSGTRTGIRTRATGPEPGSSDGITSSQLLASVRSVAYVIQ